MTQAQPDKRRGPGHDTQASPKSIATDIKSLPQTTVSRRRRAPSRLEPREGWKKPPTDHEAPHPFWVDYDRHRVICRECPWHWVRLGATRRELQMMGQRHRANMREAPE